MLGQVVACGKLVSGAIRSDSKVIVMPAGELATVRIIEWGSSRLNIAVAVDNIATGLQGIDPIHVMSGGVLWHPDYTVSTSFSLELKILVVDIAVPILPGLQFELHIHHAWAWSGTQDSVAAGPEDWQGLGEETVAAHREAGRCRRGEAGEGAARGGNLGSIGSGRCVSTVAGVHECY